MVRYRFSNFTLAPGQRLLLRDGRAVPLIPRYFDLLLLLIERRREAVHRREIFDRVWTDVIVSDSALSQAVRTIRRALDDDPKEPRFIRTVSRHGYQFVFAEVIEDTADAPLPPAAAPAAPQLAPVEAPEEEDDPESWREVRRVAAKRWFGASSGCALAGIAAGGIGGLILAAAPGSSAPLVLSPVLAVIGGGCGALGGAGVGVGLAVAEASARSQRALALIVAGALGGGFVGLLVQLLARWSLASLVGLNLDVGGGAQGLALGGAAGLGYAIATRTMQDGLAAPRGRKRMQAALIVAITSGVAGLLLSLGGWPLAGGTIHTIADAAEGSRATFAPLGRLIGEPGFGPMSRAILSFGEGGMFGLGLAYGLMRRPQVPHLS